MCMKKIELYVKLIKNKKENKKEIVNEENITNKWRTFEMILDDDTEMI